jgi:AraC family transcriptional regulator
MVCNRCIMVVKDILKKNGVQPVSVMLGDAELDQPPTVQQLQNISADLQAVGFEILEDQKKKLTEQIKNIITREVGKNDRDNNFSEILSSTLHKDYSYLSKLFSEAEGITIEKYIIDQKIEKVKELLAYDELSLSEIAFKLDYSSVAHLSSQFKKTTGFSPSNFRKLKDHHRRPLDEL